MNFCRTLRAFTNLAVDAVEAVAYWLDFSDVADEIWAESSSSASASQAADGEPSGDSVPTQDVESPLGLQSVDITPADLEYRAGIQLKQAIK